MYFSDEYITLFFAYDREFWFLFFEALVFMKSKEIQFEPFKT